MLKDEAFASKAKVDRYGRRLPKDSGRKELERFYRVEENESGDDAEEEVDDDDEVERELQRVEGGYDPARNGGFSSSSSDESSSAEDEEKVEADEDEVFGFPDQGDGIPMGEISPRIAIVNLDWDNIRATDLMAVFSSFAPSNGRILKVSVYPSEFGKERMEREEMEGPPKEIFARNGSSGRNGLIGSGSEEDEEDEDEEEDEKIKKSILKEDQGEEFDPAKLRRYQLERLRYYYAVLNCSSAAVAEAIYNAVDGTEYLTTANFFDLRFIPDDMDFSEDKPRDECERIPDGYRPNEFVTDALQHSKVRLTWDADDGTRKEVQKRAFAGSRADINENDLKAYLGSDSSEDGGLEPIVVDATTETTGNGSLPANADAPQSKMSKRDAERQRMRALLGLGEQAATSKKSKAGPVGDMQITFSSGLSAAPASCSVFENEPEREGTTIEKYVRREKERKARRKEKMKSSRNGTEPSEVKEDKDNENAIDAITEPSDLGFEDPFFTAPTEDKAATTALRKEQKRVKLAERAAAEAVTSAQRAELELLMVDDDKAGGPIHHFDIKEIAKAEKAMKKGKRKRLSAREKEALEAKEKDAFRMDVEDPRFSAVFERSEFAIDPSNPRFKGTEGMKALLEEGRRKRRRGEEGERDEEVVDRGKGKNWRKKGNVVEEGAGGEDLQRLVERVKGKTKKV